MAYPRTFLDLQNEVLAHGFDGNTYRPRVQQWLNEGLHRVARKVRVPGRESSQAITTAAGTATVAQPTDFVRPLSLRNTTDHADLTPVDIDVIDNSPAASGKPTVFAFYGQVITLYPTPNAAYALSLRYRANTVNLALDLDVPGLPDDYVDVLVSYALSRAYRSEDDAEMSAFYQNEFVRDFRDLRADLQNLSPGPRQVPGMWATGQPPSFVVPG